MLLILINAFKMNLLKVMQCKALILDLQGELIELFVQFRFPLVVTLDR